MNLTVPEEAVAVINEFAARMEMPPEKLAEMYLMIGALNAVFTLSLKDEGLLDPFLARYSETIGCFEEKLREIVLRN